MNELEAVLRNCAKMCVSNIVGTQEINGQKGLVDRVYEGVESYNPRSRGKLNCPNCCVADSYEAELKIED